MESNRLEIRRLRAQYLLPAEHPYPEKIKDRLDRIIRRDLVPSIATALGPWFSDADSSIWLIRELRFESTVNIAWETDQLSRAMTSRLARAFDANLQGDSDDGNVRYFPNRAAYLSSFLTDLAAGSAWSQWYYESFHGLKMLPISAALRTAICDDPKTGKESLSQLTNDELKKIVRALTPQDACGVVETFADHLERGDDASCCQKVWNEWEKNVTDPSVFGDEWQRVLYLSIRAGHDQEGIDLEPTARALVRLHHRLINGSVESGHRLVYALTHGQLSALYMVAGASSAEILSPLMRCPPEWVIDVADSIMTQIRGQSNSIVTNSTGRRDTGFGGVFLLLPLLDELPLAEATRDWPHSDAAAAISLVRFLLLVKCCGEERARHMFYDPVMRDLLLIPPTISPEFVLKWQTEITRTHLNNFLGTLEDWQWSRGAIDRGKLILTLTGMADQTVTVLIDAARGLWLSVDLGRLEKAVAGCESLRQSVAKLEGNAGALICDSSIREVVSAEFSKIKVTTFEEQEADKQVGEIFTRLDKLPDELSFLSMAGSLELRPLFDLTLSVAAQQLLRNFAWRLPGFARSNLPYLSNNFLDFAGCIDEESDAPRRATRSSATASDLEHDWNDTAELSVELARRAPFRAVSGRVSRDGAEDYLCRSLAAARSVVASRDSAPACELPTVARRISRPLHQR